MSKPVVHIVGDDPTFSCCNLAFTTGERVRSENFFIGELSPSVSTLG
jgi:hypothetical protein